MDIISLPVVFDNKKIDSKYRLVTIASQRAKELAFGAKPRIPVKARKITSIAIEETVSNALEYLTGEEARVAKEEASKFDYRKFLEESRKGVAGEELTEIEKDLKVYLDEKETADKKTFEELFGEEGGNDTKE
jgi:DNA-directed RNA polymerase omega subunit